MSALEIGVMVLMILAEKVDAHYTRQIYNHKKLPHGWDQT